MRPRPFPRYRVSAGKGDTDTDDFTAAFLVPPSLRLHYTQSYDLLASRLKCFILEFKPVRNSDDVAGFTPCLQGRYARERPRITCELVLLVRECPCPLVRGALAMGSELRLFVGPPQRTRRFPGF